MKLKSLEVQGLRGIPEPLKIAPECKNVVIFGHNGTGKSAIIDSIDFLLTGKITRLIGEGSANIKKGKHWSHVDKDKGTVKGLFLLEDEEVTLERDTKYSYKLKIEPKELKDKVIEILGLAENGQNLLTRSGILKFITSTAGDRAQEIMSLLHLSKIEKIRRRLQNAKYKAEKANNESQSKNESNKEEIKQLLGLKHFSEEKCLKKCNEIRTQLGKKKIKQLEKKKILKNFDQSLFKGQERVMVDEIKNTIIALKEQLEKADETLDNFRKFLNILKEISKRIKLDHLSAYKNLFDAGFKLVEENECPLCGKEWNEKELKKVLKKRKTQIVDFGEENEEKIRKQANSMRQYLVKIETSLSKIKEVYLQYELSYDEDKLKSLLDSVKKLKIKLEGVMENLGENWQKHEKVFLNLKENWIKDELLKKMEDFLINQAKREEIKYKNWTTIIKLGDRIQKFNESLKEFTEKTYVFEGTELLYEAFNASRNEELEKIYESIKKNFASFYTLIHAEDEEDFEAEFSHDEASLEIGVDFYGRGRHPPHALHSEGHQDSMGICIFLALNKMFTKDKLNIVLLDDVMMSIDKNHRKQLCSLFNSEFPNKQFIITTHSRTWAEQLQSSSVVTRKNMLHFTSWDVETGPVFHVSALLWERIESKLKDDDVPGAAGLLRRDSEFFFQEVCEALKAKIPYKIINDPELGELLDEAYSTFTKTIKKAKAYYNEKNNKEKISKINELESKIKEAYKRTKANQWAVNASVHYNQWAELSPTEFKPIVKAFHDLFESFRCPECHSLIKKTKNSSNKSLSCNGGEINWVYT
ncbi:AAA family ATPase [Candidatus Woesearchaeota archaeon]|nr:AAA family ATPase [Candidatus Woesearchaeota archaeon]